MRVLPSCRQQQRRGAVAPLGGILLVAVLGMVAFAVDLAWIVVAQSELQNAADSAALAGAKPLGDSYLNWAISTSSSGKSSIVNAAMTSARAKAKEYAAYNAAGGVAGLTLRDEDVEFGYTDTAGAYTEQSKTSNYPNTIKVLMRRDALANGSLSLFFGPVLGRSSTDLQASAGATVYGAVVDGVQNPPTANVGMLPMAYDAADWDNYIKTGKGPDGTWRVVSGVSALQVYPVPNDKGNFGQLALDDEHAGASEIRNWIDYGLTAADVQMLYDHKLLPLSGHDATQWDWLGNPGFKASTVMAINDYAGKTLVMPLFTPKDGSSGSYQAGVGEGSHYNYNIVRFVGVKIVPVSQTNQEILVAPAMLQDPNLTYSPSSVAPLGTSTTLTTMLLPPKLTR